MTHNTFYYECPWCGNRWEQEEKEPRRCEVCKHYIWEGTHEEHMKFPDLEAWKEFQEQIDWNYRAHEDIRK